MTRDEIVEKFALSTMRIQAWYFVITTPLGAWSRAEKILAYVSAWDAFVLAGYALIFSGNAAYLYLHYSRAK